MTPDHRATLLALAGRVEQARGPDREADHRLFCVAYGWDYPLGGASSAEYKAVGSPAYTASIDAALTLVPEGWRLSMLTSSHMAKSWSAQLWVMDEWVDLRPDVPVARAATPALALCAPALRTRAA